MKVNVYGTAVCPNCKTVTKYLEEKGIDYTYETVGEDLTIYQLTEIVGHPVRSVPVIMMDDKETDFGGLKTRLNQLEILSAGVEALQGLSL